MKIIDDRITRRNKKKFDYSPLARANKPLKLYNRLFVASNVRLLIDSEINLVGSWWQKIFFHRDDQNESRCSSERKKFTILIFENRRRDFLFESTNWLTS